MPFQFSPKKIRLKSSGKEYSKKINVTFFTRRMGMQGKRGICVISLVIMFTVWKVKSQVARVSELTNYYILHLLRIREILDIMMP